MLLNNLSIYQDILKRSKHEIVQREDKRYEVERLYSTSPIIFDYSETYLPDGMYMVEETEPRKSIIFDNQDNKSESSEDDTNEEKKKAFPKASVLTFRRVPIKRKKEDEPPPISVLSRQIEECVSLDDDNDADKDSGGIPLTIYLPDYNSIMVNVKETSNFKEVIQQVLVSHEKQGVEPPLDYRDPGMYELRIHEGDGEPDRDFPALGPDKLLSDFNLDEYCICVVEGRRRAATGPGTSSTTRPAANTAVTDNSISTFTPPLPHLMPSSAAGSGIPRSNSGGGLLGTSSSYAQSALNSYTGRQRDDTADTLGIRGRTRTSSKMSYDSFQTHTISTLMVLFPDGTQVVAPFGAETKLLDLLPPISKVKRLKLYTNEYVFCVSSADQKRLKLMSPFLDMQQPVSTIGATSLEIHNKVYQDVGKMEKSAAAAAAKKKKTTKKKSNFTEAMANAYQEWNVVKKNKFGRKQERVFGVDGKKIYNSKRGQLRGGNQTGVQRAERNISTIVKLDILPHDTKTFRITWMDDRDVYNIEYTCETQRECAEIVAKINYTREKYK